MHLSIISDILIMNLQPSKISIRKSKNKSKAMVRDRESLTLKHPMELLAWAINIESGIELRHYLLIPVTIESHDILQVHIVTGADGLSNH